MAYLGYATVCKAVNGGQTGGSSPVASTSTQLTLWFYWIQHTLVHHNKAHNGQ